MPAPRYSPYGRGIARWEYMAGGHLMAPESEADVSAGIVRDIPRSELPPGHLYDAADFLLDQPGVARKRGGTAYAGPAMSAASYAASVAYADFPAGAKLLAVGDNGHLYTVAGSTTDIATLGTGFPGVDRPKLRIGGGKNLLVIPAANGTTAPQTYDGTTVAVLGGTPPAGRYVEVYKTRIVLANISGNENRLFFSPTPDPTTAWDTTNSWIDCDYELTGLAATANALFCFSRGHVERIVGSTPPPNSDMDRATIASVGCIDARSIVVRDDTVIFANPAGVYLTNGAGVSSLTNEGQIGSYWQTLMAGYSPATFAIAAGLYRNFYHVSIMVGPVVIAALVCNIPRRAWWRLTNVKAAMFASALRSQEELYYADRSTNRIVALSGTFSPSSANESDADGTAVAPLLEFRMIGAGPAVKAFGFGRLFYDILRSGSSTPTLAVSVAAGIEAPTFAAAPESPLAHTTATPGVSVATRKRFQVNKDTTGVSVRLQQSGASTKTEIYNLEIESRTYPQTRDGQ